MRTNKRKSIAWGWCMDCGVLALEDGDVLATLTPNADGSYGLGVHSALRGMFVEKIKIKLPGKQLEDKATARVRFHLGRFARESAKATRAEVRRFRMFQTRSGK